MEVGADQDLVGEAGVEVADDRQVLPLHLEPLGRLVGVVQALRHHDGDPVALPPAHVGGHPGAAGGLDPEQDGLVEHREAVLVDGHVARR